MLEGGERAWVCMEGKAHREKGTPIMMEETCIGLPIPAAADSNPLSLCLLLSLCCLLLSSSTHVVQHCNEQQDAAEDVLCKGLVPCALLEGCFRGVSELQAQGHCTQGRGKGERERQGRHMIWTALWPLLLGRPSPRAWLADSPPVASALLLPQHISLRCPLLHAPVRTNTPMVEMKPERKELKGKVPTRAQ